MWNSVNHESVCFTAAVDLHICYETLKCKTVFVVTYVNPHLVKIYLTERVDNSEM